MNQFKVRDVVIGTGKPKICVSMLSTTKEALITEAKSLLTAPVDIVEWRADYFAMPLDSQTIADVLISLRHVLGNTPLLFTLRTTIEGGRYAFTAEDYYELNRCAITSGSVDFVDVEILRDEKLSCNLIESAHTNKVKVIGSFHDFEKTLSGEDIKAMIQKMQVLDVDLCKIAVMPQSRAEVLLLLKVTLEVSECIADRPFAIIGMGSLGMITRVSGELLGTSITFGSSDKASAPGQIQVDLLAEIMDVLQLGTSCD